jgi:hypothetical protein
MNSQNISLSDTFNNYHTYEIDWTPDTITWSVDGQVGRVKNREDTWNATANRWDFPQTPARVQLSLWPGGLDSNAQGTIDWAGGLVDWGAPDIQNNGYYYAAFKSVSIECYNGKTAPGTNSGVSYKYNSRVGTNDTVVDGDDPTVLGSLQATGEDMDAGKPSGTDSVSTPTATAGVVPGLSGAGPGSDSHVGDTSGSGSGNSPVATIGSGPAATSASDSGPTGSSGGSFDQGTGSSGSSGSSDTKTGGADRIGGQERVLGGSVFAGIVAVVALMAL